MGTHEEYYMQQALKEARKAYDEDEVPVGAVIVIQDKIIARGYNQVEKLHDATAHAEIIALTSAYNFLGAKYLPEATMYVTIEPCIMCAGALYWSKIAKLVYGANDEKHGGVSLSFARSGQTKPGKILHPKTKILANVYKDDCVALMKDFFNARR